MKSMQVVIEGWDGDGTIRVPDEVLPKLGAATSGIASISSKSTLAPPAALPSEGLHKCLIELMS